MKNEVQGVKAPQKDCTDKNCPFHGEIAVKNEFFKGILVKKDINRSATIEWFKSFRVPKYERFEVRRSRIRVHNPACIDAAIGQEVMVARTRPISKAKHHVIIQITNIEKKIDFGGEDKIETKKKTTQKTKDSVVSDKFEVKEKNETN
jgi:small subunit ribosomal protein S17